MNKTLIKLFSINLIMFFFFCQSASAVGHYPPGGEGVGGAVLPPSCLPIPNNPKTSAFHYQGKLIYYTADVINDDDGDKALDVDLGILVEVNRFVYVKKINNTSDWALHLLIPLQKTDLQLTGILEDDQTGLGDCLLEGAYAIHKEKFDYLLAAGLVAPTGSFDTSEPASIGLGYWTLILTGGINYKFGEKKLWSVSALNRILINTEQNDTNITPGMEFVSEFGIGKIIPKSPTFLITPGLFGHIYSQLSDNDSDTEDDTRSRSFSLGLECNFFSLTKAIQFNVRISQEFGVKSDAEGRRYEIKFSKSWF